MSRSPALYKYALFCAFATFCLVIAGALVTSTGSGLSVPTWPFAPHHLLPPLVGGVLFEYGHRMVAGLVILLTGILVFRLYKGDTHKNLRGLGLAAAAAIVLQAALGGITVLTGLPPAISLAHAALAQAFFTIMVTLAFLANPALAGKKEEAAERRPLFLALTLITPLLIYLQILIGALVRHIGAALIIPDFPLAFGRLIPPARDLTFPVAANFAHTRIGALVVTFFILWTSILALRSTGREIRRTGMINLLLLAIQLFLGMEIILSWRAIPPTTAHVAVGALLLASNVILALQARHPLIADRQNPSLARTGQR